MNETSGNTAISIHSGCPTVTLFSADSETSLPLQLAFAALSAGFPSPALDFDDVKIDLNKELIWHPASTFFGRVSGHSMQDAGIGDGDLLIIDKSLEPAHGKVAVCFLDGEFTVKRLKIEKGATWLMPANESFAPIPITPASDFRIWGIVTYSIKAHYL